MVLIIRQLFADYFALSQHVPIKFQSASELGQSNAFPFWIRNYHFCDRITKSIHLLLRIYYRKENIHEKLELLLLDNDPIVHDIVIWNVFSKCALHLLHDFWDSFYLPGLILISFIVMCGMTLLSLSQTATMQPLKLGNGWIISFQIFRVNDHLFFLGFKLIHVRKRGPYTIITLIAISFYIFLSVLITPLRQQVFFT